MVISATCKDASGNPCVDGYPSLTGLKANKALGGASTIALNTGFASAVYINGSADSQSYYLGSVTTKYNHYAPAADGEFIVTGEDSNGVTITAKATVSDARSTAAATAAADAAAEATDAANAATDAANAAAEAADAATAAAQDAADAVAALSASVSEMVNALKKQITSLTNLVIKIQKKVRA
jgi:flagellin-like hook-associated protein FlgL